MSAIRRKEGIHDDEPIHQNIDLTLPSLSAKEHIARDYREEEAAHSLLGTEAGSRRPRLLAQYKSGAGISR